MDKRARPDLDARLAEELDGARLGIEDLAVLLCMDPAVFDRHAHALQRVDELVQVIGEVARMLRERATWPDAVDTIRLEAMRERLQDAR